MAFSGSQKTRLGLSGLARSLYGTFSGKKQDTTRNIGTITRLGLSGITRGLYGSFEGKGLVIPSTGGGGGYDDDEEILAVIMAYTGLTGEP